MTSCVGSAGRSWNSARTRDLAPGSRLFRPRDDEVIRFRFRFRFVQDNMTELPVKRMCELAEIPRSSFYEWLTRKPSAREVADGVLLETIRDIYQRSRNTYGVPRMLGQLQRRGHRIARSHVARLMRTNGLVGAHASKKWRRGRPDAGGVADLLNRDFRADRPNQRWVADITEFATGDGKLYLAAVRDLHHRGIVGWDTAARQDAALVVSALTMALAPAPGTRAMSCTTPTRAPSTRRSTSRSLPGTPTCNSPSGRPATPTTTPRWRPRGHD